MFRRSSSGDRQLAESVYGLVLNSLDLVGIVRAGLQESLKCYLHHLFLGENSLL